MKNIQFGKLIDGKPKWYPQIFFFGGFVFALWWTRSVMFALPDWLQRFLESIGIDTIGD